MDLESVVENIICTKIDEVFDVEVDRKLDSLVKEEVKKSIDNISEDTLFSGDHQTNAARSIRDYASKYISTEIGNRLRCGCYDNILFKKVFDENFDTVFKDQIKSEIRMQISKQTKELVKTELSKIIDIVKKYE